MKTSSNTPDSFLNRLFAKKEQVAVAKFESMEPRLMLSGSMADNPYEDAFDDYADSIIDDSTNKADEFTGNGANDEFSGGNGDDMILGRGGDDVLLGENGQDTVIGGGGDDMISGGNGKDLLLGRRGDDIILGDNGDDTLKGGSGDDQLYGGNGDDVLRGARGDDMLFGENGSDWLRVGVGQDTMNGGDGGDYFVFGYNLVKDITDVENVAFTKAGEVLANKTTIQDFTSGQDKIVIQNGLINQQIGLPVEEGAVQLTRADYGFDNLHINYADADEPGSAVITFKGTGGLVNKIVVEGVEEGGLTADDFIIGGKTSATHFVNKTGRYIDR